MEIFSAGYVELCKMFSISHFSITKDTDAIRFEVNGDYDDRDLIRFLRHEITAKELLACKQPPTDDSSKQTFD